MTVTAHQPASAGAAQGRPRPRVHFTAAEGWINDAYGITWTGDRYRMFYQAMPARTTWAPECNWGAAESTDLVHWNELPLALQPQPFEIGCWSGSAVLSAQPPRVFYTRISESDWAKGAVATATGDANFGSWSTSIDDMVLPGPPPDLGVTTFRDPYVFRHGDEWHMVVGAGLADGSGAVVQLRSSDLVSWTCDGLLCSLAADAAPVPTGQVWECPQLFPLDDAWVLLVSVWHDDELYHVAAAVGDYDGRRFEPRCWQRLTYGSSAYAMTAFVDEDGRRCVLSWLREEPRNDPDRVGWVGALSVPAVVSFDDSDRLVLIPHPVLRRAGQHTAGPSAIDVDGGLRVALNAAAVELTVHPAAGSGIAIEADSAELARLEFGDDHLEISRSTMPSDTMPVDATRPLVVLIDADIVEVFGPGGYGAFRIAAARDAATTELAFSSPHPELSLRTL